MILHVFYMTGHILSLTILVVNQRTLPQAAQVGDHNYAYPKPYGIFPGLLASTRDANAGASCSGKRQRKQVIYVPSTSTSQQPP